MYLAAVSDTKATLLPSQKGMCNCYSKNALHLLLFGSGRHQSPAAKSPFVYVSQPLIRALLLLAVPLLYHSESSAWHFNMDDYRSTADALL